METGLLIMLLAVYLFIIYIIIVQRKTSPPKDVSFYCASEREGAVRCQSICTICKNRYNK